MNMKKSLVLLFTLGFLGGCNSDNETAPSPGGSASPHTSSSTTAPSTTGSVSTQPMTVQGNGFSFQIPADWQDVSEAGLTIVSSPIDASQGNFGTRVNFSRSTQNDPAASIERSVNTARSGAQPEDTLEITEVDVSGTTATRVDHIIASPIGAQMEIKLLVPLSDGVLSVRVFDQEEKVRPLLDQIDSILASLRLD